MSKTEVIKHSSTIQIANSITLLQRRTWNVLLANAYDDLPNKDEYSIDLFTIYTEIGFNSKNREYLQDALKGMMGCIVEWNILDKDAEEWAAMPILGQVKIKANRLYYSYAPELRRKLYNPRMYARISLSMQRKFNSKYSLALYELFIDYYDVHRSYGETSWIEIDQYRKLMGIEENEYNEFRELKRRTIKNPLEEINKKSDLLVEDVYRTEGRRVLAVKFKIKKKEGSLLLPVFNSQPDLFEANIQAKLEKLLITHEKAIELSKRFDEQTIEKWIECIELGYVKNINNKPGYLIAALESDYTFPIDFEAFIKEREFKSKETKKKLKRKNSEEQLKIKKASIRKAYEDKFLVLTNEEKQKVISEAIQKLEHTDRDQYNFISQLYANKYSKDLSFLTVENFNAIDSIIIRPVIEEYRNKILDQAYMD